MFVLTISIDRPDLFSRCFTTISVPQADLNEAALRRTHSRVAEPTVEVI
jgi:hypothetical protein